MPQKTEGQRKKPLILYELATTTNPKEYLMSFDKLFCSILAPMLLIGAFCVPIFGIFILGRLARDIILDTAAFFFLGMMCVLLRADSIHYIIRHHLVSIVYSLTFMYAVLRFYPIAGPALWTFAFIQIILSLSQNSKTMLIYSAITITIAGIYVSIPSIQTSFTVNEYYVATQFVLFSLVYIVASIIYGINIAHMQTLERQLTRVQEEIVEREAAESKLEIVLKRAQSMINNHEAVMLLIEPSSGVIIEANRAATNFYGYSKDELLQMKIQDLNQFDPDETERVRLKDIQRGQNYSTFPHRLKNGDTRIVDVYSSQIEYDDHQVLFSIIFDVTRREEIARQNEYMAYHDYLTGLYNRRYYEEEFQRLVETQDFPVGLFMGDVDGFKEYNDSYGHAEGDRMLRGIAADLRMLVGNDGILARISGDEFAIIVSGKNKQQMRAYLDMLNHEHESTLNAHMPDELPTISWGYALQKEASDTLDTLETNAEAFMYNRKYYSHQSSRSKTVDAIMQALFTKSEREKKHSERVGLLAEEIAKHLHLSNEQVDKIRIAGFLHDIGKIGIDEAILNKAGSLDDDEWAIIKLHPAKSAGILDKTSEYQEISPIVLAHHERFDGHGYPGQLLAKAIPLEARIIAVADTYDAITNNRPYRKALDKEAAIKELKRCAGTQLDPEIVSVFISMLCNEQEKYDTSN